MEHFSQGSLQAWHSAVTQASTILDLFAAAGALGASGQQLLSFSGAAHGLQRLHITMRSPAVLLALLALLAGPAAVAARHTFAEIRRDDRSLILVAQPFGFGEGGRMNITVSNFELWRPGAAGQSKSGPFHR